ncbi:MAG: amino acid ABC transporter permease [Streptococcaceae bacterium]|jgi:polar amino acid transport system permease protein|nr:amino acid ABC transporter permease [Streptococcaceae bacterium]MCH4176267.1 amino acid ABC transporter permease [Streptococcaceae bacterium]
MSYILEILPALIKGTVMTLKMFGITLLGSVPLGLLVAFGLRTKFKPLTYLLNIYVWIMRGTPLLLQLIFIFYGLPLLQGGIVFERFDAAAFAFILNYGAYFAEIFRGGLQAIPKGQYEAAKVLKFSKFETARYIILPQVFKIVLPAGANEVINLVKDSSLIYVLGLGDLLRAGKIAMSRDISLTPMVLVAAIYLLLIGCLTLVAKQVEKHYDGWK